PITARDLARIELDGVRNTAEPGVSLHPLVELARVSAQGVDEAISRKNGIGAAFALAHMHGLAADFQAKPHYTHRASQDLRRRWLRDEAGIRAIAAGKRRERSVASRFFLRHGLNVDVSRGPEASIAQRVERKHHGGHARLHIVGAAAVELPVPFG